MRSIEEIKKDLFTNWRDKNGYIQIYSPTNGKGEPDNHNQNTFEGYSFYFLKKLGALTEEDKAFGRKLLEEHMTRDADGNPIPGLFNRHPRSHEDTKIDDVVSHDEYTGFVAIAYACGASDILRQIVDRGYKTGFVYNNHDPENKDPMENARYTRQGVNVAYMQLLAGDKPTQWNVLWFCLSVLFTAFKEPKDTDGKQMAMVKLGLCKKYSKAIWFTDWIWNIIIKRQYKGFEVNGKKTTPIESVFRWYFKNQSFPQSELAELYDAKRFG